MQGGVLEVEGYLIEPGEYIESEQPINRQAVALFEGGEVQRGDGHHAFTLPSARRTYISSAAFEGGPETGLEWALAHETAHLNDPRAPALQQKFDREIDATARENLGRWLRDPRAGAYRKLQGIARQAWRGVEPEPSPIVPLAEQAAPRRSRLPLQVQPIRER